MKAHHPDLDMIEVTMLENDKDRMTMTQIVLSTLNSRTGADWKEVKAEPQPSYSEMVIWILLYENSDIQAVHQVFCDIMRPLVDDLQPLELALFYEEIEDEMIIGVDQRIGNESVFLALQQNNLGVNRKPRPRKNISFYSATDSTRTAQ
ncbi:MAG: hypothetical protein ACSHXH_17870 [Marivita sp.]